jgi:hypothetical protein
MDTGTTWTRFEEPLYRTLRRNFAIAAVIAGVLAFRRHQFAFFLPFFALAIWFSLGGHYVEVAFLNGLRPRIPVQRAAQIGGRVATWFAGGAILFLFMLATARLLHIQALRLQMWWMAGLAFIGIELIAHAVLALRRCPNFYNGRG